jgi:hypothetical protein
MLALNLADHLVELENFSERRKIKPLFSNLFLLIIV